MEGQKEAQLESQGEEIVNRTDPNLTDHKVFAHKP